MRTTLALVAALALAPLTGHAADKHDDGPVCTGGPSDAEIVANGQRYLLHCDDGTNPWVTTYVTAKPQARGWR